MIFTGGSKPRTFFSRTPAIACRGTTIVRRRVGIACRGAGAGRRAVVAAASLQRSSRFKVLEVGGAGGIEADSRGGTFERRRLYFVDTC